MGPLGIATLRACIAEVTAPKAGNVHRHADFADLTFTDFVLSAGAIAPILDGAADRSLGATIREAVMATRQVTNTNTNLGIILLLAPMAAAGRDRHELARRLAAGSIDDTRWLYEAIRLAHPGGLGKVEAQDIADVPTLPLIEVMRFAVERDQIAAQYVNGFADVFEFGIPTFEQALSNHGTIDRAICECQLAWLRRSPDSLIARKHGQAVARSVQEQAQTVQYGESSWHAFDALLRQQRWNPGTTADLVTASIFGSAWAIRTLPNGDETLK